MIYMKGAHVSSLGVLSPVVPFGLGDAFLCVPHSGGKTRVYHIPYISFSDDYDRILVF